MSLLAWYPLNGDSKNRGVLGKEMDPTETSAVYVDGKIGKSLYTGYLTLSAAQMERWIGNTVSIAMWIYTRSDGTYSAGTPFFGYSGMNAPTNRKFSMFHYPNINALHCSWQNDDNTMANGSTADNEYFTCRYDNFFPSNQWVHLCVVQDGANETITIYRNGVQHSKTSVPGLSTTAITRSASATIRNNINYQNTCDIRIYDHALSASEVKEISKGLIVHYSFNDTLSEPTTNVNNASGWSYYDKYWTISSKSDESIKLYRHSTSTNTVVALSNSTVQSNFVEGDIWTLSCYLYINGEPFKCPSSYASSYTTFNKVISRESRDDGYYRTTFEIRKNSNSTYDSWIFHAAIFGSIGTDIPCEIKYLQIEKKGFATAYTLGTRTSSIYNETGLSQPETVSNIALSSDSASGTFSFQGSSANYIVHTPIGDGSHGATASMWIKASLSSNWVAFADSNSQLGFGCYSNYGVIASTSGTNKRRVTNLSSLWKADGWNHVVVTMSSDNTVNRCWINGVEGTYGAADHWTHKEKFTIGCRYNGSYSMNFTGLLDDFRFYNTCLSDTDIQELYKTRAYITKLGDIETNQFIEGKTQAQVTKDYTFEAANINEGIDGYAFLEYIESSGTQYLNTEYTWTSEKTLIVADINPITVGSGQTLFGNEEYFSSSGRYFSHIVYKSGSVFYYYLGTGSGSTFDIVTNKRQLFESFTNNSRACLRTDGNNLEERAYSGYVQSGNYSNSTNSTKGYIHIFCNYNTGRGGALQVVSKMRLYRFTMYDNDIIVRDIVPCVRISDGAVGAYDLVNNKFIPNSGTGTFIKGPILSVGESASINKNKNISGRNLIEI